MLLGHKEATNVHGVFREYEYRTEVTKGDETEVYYGILFARNDEQAYDIVRTWQNQCTGARAMYKYFLPSFTGVGNLTATHIIEKTYAANGYKFLLSLEEIGSREFIH